MDINNFFFSAVTGGFYSDYEKHLYIDAGTWPADAKPIDSAKHAELIAGQATGMSIKADKDGNPVLVAHVVEFAAQAAAYLGAVRITREAILNRLAGFGMAALAAGDTASAHAITTARQSLLDMTALASVTSAATIDELKAAVQTECLRIAADVPETVRKAFDNADI